MRRLQFILFLFTFIACRSNAQAGCPGGECVVPAGGDLQAALNLAIGGDTIKLEAAATFVGPFSLPVHSGASFVTITTTGSVPPVVSVIDACYQQGGDFASEMAKKAKCRSALIAQYSGAPKIITHDQRPAISTIGGADYWKFVGVELATTNLSRGNGCTATYQIVALGMDANGELASSIDSLPAHIVFDRTYIHGNPTGCSRRAILADAVDVHIINSVCTEIHESGQDSQCYMSFNGQGPFNIDNNFIEAAGENIMFGGADPMIPGLTPSDISISNNYLTKDWSWWTAADRVGYPATGANWQVKNVLECKNCQRLKAWGNVLEGSWAYNQTGGIVLFQSLNDGGRCTWCIVQNIEMFGNVLRHGGQGLVILGKAGQNGGAAMGRNINFHDNLLYGLSTRYSVAGTSGAECYSLISGSTADVFSGVTINHNTCDNEGVTALINNCGERFSNFTYTNNIARSREFHDAQFVFCGATGGSAGLNVYMPDSHTVTNNLFATDGGHGPWPAWNEFIPAAAWSGLFVNLGAGNFTLASGSPYKAGGSRQARDGKDLGANMALLPKGTNALNVLQAPNSPTNLRIVQ